MSTQQIVPGKTGKKNTQKPQSRFQSLWSEAEALASENAKLEKELDNLVRRVSSDIMTAERNMGETIRDVVYRQIDFAGKKSLLKWQRFELNDWMEQNLSELMMMGLLDEPLQNKIALLRASQMGIDIDPESDLSPAEQLDRYFGVDDDDDDDDDYGLDDTDASGDNTTADMFDDDFDDDMDETQKVEFDDDSAEEEMLEELLRKLRAEFEEDEAEAEDERAAHFRQSENPITDDVLKRLFRQTAAVLHPDKEPDAQRRQEKHELMSQLLKARKERDLITIVKLHEEHSPADSGFSMEDEQALEEVLVDYLNQQQQRMEEIVEQSPMHRMAYSEFYSQKPETVTRKINAHLKKIDERHQSLQHFVTEVKTLKRLKEILSARYDAQSFGGGW